MKSTQWLFINYTDDLKSVCPSTGLTDSRTPLSFTPLGSTTPNLGEGGNRAQSTDSGEVQKGVVATQGCNT